MIFRYVLPSFNRGTEVRNCPYIVVIINHMISLFLLILDTHLYTKLKAVLDNVDRKFITILFHKIHVCAFF